MVPNGALGILVMILAGVLNTGNFVLSKALQEWPYFAMFCASNLVISLGTAIGIMAMGSPPLRLQDLKWVALRGLSGASAYVFAVIAMKWGTPIGDVAVFTSINMVIAAFLGRLFLGEPLRALHSAGLCCSLAGAILISKPSFLFPTSNDAQGSRWVGYALALTSGFFVACIYVCSRKSAKVSAWIHLCSTTVSCSIVGFVLPFLPFISEPAADIVERSPFAALGWLALVTSCLFFSGMAVSVASRWCPAAVSATTVTTVRMVCSYAAQALLFDEAVELLTLLGAALMLASVAIMAGAGSTAAAAEAPAETDAEDVAREAPEAAPDASSTAEDVETQSLASFIASEFTGQKAAVRLRRVSTEPAAQQLGAVAALATVAI